MVEEMHTQLVGYFVHFGVAGIEQLLQIGALFIKEGHSSLERLVGKLVPGQCLHRDTVTFRSAIFMGLFELSKYRLGLVLIAKSMNFDVWFFITGRKQ